MFILHVSDHRLSRRVRVLALWTLVLTSRIPLDADDLPVCELVVKDFHILLHVLLGDLWGIGIIDCSGTGHVGN